MHEDFIVFLKWKILSREIKKKPYSIKTLSNSQRVCLTKE